MNTYKPLKAQTSTCTVQKHMSGFTLCQYNAFYVCMSAQQDFVLDDSAALETSD